MNKLSDRELLELFGSLVKENQKAKKEDSKLDELRKRLQENMGHFPERFADGAETLLNELEALEPNGH